MYFASNALRPGIAEVRTGKGLVILINQGLLSDHKAKEAVNRQLIAKARLHRYFWHRKGKLIFLEKEFPLEFIVNS
ncbi:hypothetical protein EID71_17250 [Salmonella enterica subsp. indica serovar 11:b:e,n,x]|nr:hypothetical protein [Salmonella enterica subsp. indica serovar 11:b:e,n,x]